MRPSHFREIKVDRFRIADDPPGIQPDDIRARFSSLWRE